jgi:hypothetical protein
MSRGCSDAGKCINTAQSYPNYLLKPLLTRIRNDSEL